METSLLRRHSGPFLRAASRTFTNGAAVLPEPRQGDSERGAQSETTESTPLREPTRREATREQVEQRIMAEINTIAVRWRWVIIPVVVLLLSFLCMALFFYIMALVAACNFHHEPCDKPLKYYLIVGLLWAQCPSYLTRCVQSRIVMRPLASALLVVAVSIPGWFIIAWGVWMVNTAKTCPKTNPELFWPTRRFIYSQIGFAGTVLIVSLVAILSLRRVLLAVVSSFVAQPGCALAVHLLPKVLADAAELVDDEDGTVTDCHICMEKFAVSDDSRYAVVRTPCAHFFHEGCLATWCQNHLDCPLCRGQVGEADRDIDV